jgi:hypothetical protein
VAGFILGVESLGALAGASLLAAKGRVERRMTVLLVGMAFSGAMIVIFGTAHAAVWLGASLFLLMMPLPVEGGLATSILQTRVPPDMQGRVFAVREQLGYLGATTSFLLVGPVIDRVLEPAVGGPRWDVVAPLVGDTPGSGMGLLIVLAGLLIVAATALAALNPRVRRLDDGPAGVEWGELALAESGADVRGCIRTVCTFFPPRSSASSADCHARRALNWRRAAGWAARGHIPDAEVASEM